MTGSRARGTLPLLTIVAIFVVVIGLMYGGLQAASGELVDHEPATDREAALRAALWDAIDDRRAEEGIGPAQRSDNERVLAQDTARELAGGSYFVNATATNRTLPNGRAFCTQVAVRLDGPLPPGNGTDADVETMAVRTATLLESADRWGVLYGRNGQRNGIGVVEGAEAVYVVYRACHPLDA